MVDKKFAKWMKSPNEYEVISATRALFLKSPEGKARIITTPKEKGTLFDVETDLKVYPITGRFIKGKGRKAPDYFAYYNGEESPLKGKAQQIEWSEELQLFMKVFESIDKFQIEEEEKPAFYVIPKQMKMFERVKTTTGFVILKFLMEIDYTYPNYSQSYLYNQKIGLEFIFSRLPNSRKLFELSELGIPVFQAKASLSKWAKRDYGEITNENFEEVKDEMLETFQQRNYQLQGKFVNSIKTIPENKEKYDTLKTYEEQVEELKKQIKDLEIQKSEELKLLKTTESNVQNIQDLVTEEESKLENYKQEIKYYVKLESDNKTLTQNLGKTADKLNTVKEELKKINSVGWFKRAFKLW